MRSRKTKSFLLAAIVIFSFFLFLDFKVIKTFADTSMSGSGWLWGGTDDGAGNTDGLGWVSLNNTNTSGATSYGVTIPASDGPLSGYAWSENLGWISFNSSDLSGCPDGNCTAQRVGNNLTGWARIIGIRDEANNGNSGGWAGWIKLSGSSSVNQYQCPSSGQSYSDQATCNASCNQTANCTVNNVTASGSIDFKNTYCLFAQGNKLFGTTYSFSNENCTSTTQGSPTGTITLSGATASGMIGISPFAFSFTTILNGSNNSIVGNTANVATSVSTGAINLSGSTASGQIDRKQAITLVGTNNMLVAKDGSGNQTGAITFSGSVANSCPLSGGSACSGSPSICTAPQTCNPTTSNISYGVTIDPTTNKMSGYAWSDELGWIDFSRASLNICAPSTYTYDCINGTCGACQNNPVNAPWLCIKTDNCGKANNVSQAECQTNGKTCADTPCPACPINKNWREVAPN